MALALLLGTGRSIIPACSFLSRFGLSRISYVQLSCSRLVHVVDGVIVDVGLDTVGPRCDTFKDHAGSDLLLEHFHFRLLALILHE